MRAKEGKNLLYIAREEQTPMANIYDNIKINAGQSETPDNIRSTV